MSRKQQSITLSVSDADRTKLEELAGELGILWGERPNISKLVEAIARRKVLVVPNTGWSQDRIRVLEQAANLLLDSGLVEAAKILAGLLLERSELPQPLRSRLEARFVAPPPSWRVEIDRCILRRQPFQLFYQDVAERNWQFTVRYAQVVFREKRFYLDAWCEETEGNRDISELVHNWSFRLDRLVGVEVLETKGKWREGLASIDVELEFYGGLVFAYQPRPEDQASEVLPGGQVRRVSRRINFTFWFLREILAYAHDCKLLSPSSIQERIKTQLRDALARYEEA